MGPRGSISIAISVDAGDESGETFSVSAGDLSGESGGISLKNTTKDESSQINV